MVRLASITIVLALLAQVTLASDGVLEINQACATSTTGCFPGDTGGFPVTITAPGSYRLTSNLTVPDENTDGIDITSSYVGIDLNNFAMLGPVTCSGNPLTCTPVGQGYGVRASGARGCSVKNGSVSGMGRNGVSLSDLSEITNLRVYNNRSIGISASAFSIVSGNAVSYNGSDGISVNQGARVSGNVVFGNGGDGINVAAGTTVERNTVRSNNGFGLDLLTQATYHENSITSFVTGSGGTVRGGVNMGDNYCAGTGAVSAACP